MKHILITIINYANEKEVINFIKMISKQTISKLIDIIIVNNKSSKNKIINLANEIKAINIKTKIYYPHKNIGYLNGAIFGYNRYIQDFNKNPDWVILCNTDIAINDINFFKKIIEQKYSRDIWCIGPSVYSSKKNTYDNPHYINRCSLKKINRIIKINEYPFLAYLYTWLAFFKSKLLKKKKQKSRYVYSIHGCFFILSSTFLEKIKNFFYEPILYSEEAYLAEILLINKKYCFYDETLEIIHHENSVTGLIGIKNRTKFISNSLKYIRTKFYKENDE